MMPGLFIGKTLQVLKLTEFATVLTHRFKGDVSGYWLLITDH